MPWSPHALFGCTPASFFAEQLPSLSQQPSGQVTWSHFAGGGLVPHEADDSAIPTHNPTANACDTPNELEFLVMILFRFPGPVFLRPARIAHLGRANQGPAPPWRRS